MDAAKCIESGKSVLGIEFGSTRIKAVLIDENHKPIAEGGHEWENRFENGVWTYSLDDIWTGLKDCYANLKADVKEKYGMSIHRFQICFPTHVRLQLSAYGFHQLKQP